MDTLCISNQAAGRRIGFTIIELMVSIGIIAVLISITLPALHSARSAALEAKCLATSRVIMQGHAIWSTEHKDRWATIMPPADKGVPQIELMGFTKYFIEGINLIYKWPTLLRHAVDGADASGELMSCPIVWNRYANNIPAVEWQPQSAPMRSFFYAPALFTVPRMWDENDPDFEQLQQDPELALTAVQVSAVAYPSQKAAMFEHHDNHRSGAAIRPGMPTRVTIGFADGHAQRRRIDESLPGLTGVNWPHVWNSDFPDGDAIPFATTRLGYLGRDF